MKAKVPLIQDYPRPGWRMLPAATTGSKPGTIIAESKSKESRTVTTLAERLHVTEESVDPLELTLNINSSADLDAAVSSFIGTNLPVEATASVILTNALEVKVKMIDVIHEIATTDDAGPKIAEILPRISHEGPLLHRGDKLFVILEAYKAKQVELLIRGEDVDSLRLGAIFQKLAHGSAGIKWSKARTSSLARTFNERRRIFVYPANIGRVTAWITGTKSVKLSAPIGTDELRRLPQGD